LFLTRPNSYKLLGHYRAASYHASRRVIARLSRGVHLRKTIQEGGQRVHIHGLGEMVVETGFRRLRVILLLPQSRQGDQDERRILNNLSLALTDAQGQNVPNA
jgi:hypothetical protein